MAIDALRSRRVREQFVWWKTASAGVIAVAFLAVPALRAGVHGLIPLVAGAFFVVALATALGIVSGNGKTFIVFSASHCSTPDYKLGLLTYTGGDPLSSSSWVKSAQPPP